MIAVVNDFIRVSTALWRKQTRVNAVPISFVAPKIKWENKTVFNKKEKFVYLLNKLQARKNP